MSLGTNVGCGLGIEGIKGASLQIISSVINKKNSIYVII